MDNLVLNSKRKEKRIPYRGMVRFSADQFNWYLNKAQNISGNGIFIQTGEAFKAGTKLFLNFDLTVGPDVVKKIRTRGEVVRIAGDEEKGSGNHSQGLGLHFFLFPREEKAIRAFVEDFVKSSPDKSFAPGQSSAKHVCIEAQGTPASFLRWWFEEVVNRVYHTNGVILELAVILIFIVLGIMIFK